MKEPVAVMQLRAPSEADSCGLLAIAAFTGASFEDVVRIATILFPKHGAKGGITTPEMKKVLAELKLPCRKKRCGPDALEDIYGIALFTCHAAVVRNGLIFEPDLTVWEISDWLRAHPKQKFEGVLIPQR